MTDTETLVLDATIEAVSQTGMRKTSMSDIAARAAVSRQTVYNLFGTKDDIFHAAIVHMGERWRAVARTRLKRAMHLSEKLDVLIEVFAIDAYKFSHASPASTDMFFEARLSAPKALDHFISENRKLYEEVFANSESESFSQHLSPRLLAEHFDIFCRACVRDAQSLHHLKELTAVQKKLILFAGQSRSEGANKQV